MNQVTELTGVPLDGYVLTNFDGFKSIVDTLGGITVYVEKDMYYETGDKTDGVINLKEGEQRLNGTTALQYARFRHDAMADIWRTARQQKVLKAAAKEMLQASTLTKLPKLIPQMMDAVETNLKLSDLLKLSKVAASFDSSNVVSQTLPGVGLYLDDLSYWEVNRDLAKEIVKNLLLGITTDKVIDNLVLDLLDPEIKSHITVPGNPKDPNGTKSSGYQDFGDQGSDQKPDQGTESAGTDKDNNHADANQPGDGSDNPDNPDKSDDPDTPDNPNNPQADTENNGKVDDKPKETGNSQNPNLVITIQ